MRLLYFISLLLTIQACRISTPYAENVQFTILQINDVYEISPIEGGKSGGLARVATLKKALLQENPNTLAILAGDFLSPSFIGTLKLDNGEPIAGLQMIETLNALGLDYATFGNHEFDIKDPELLQKRIHQSQFRFVCSNVNRLKDGVAQPFTQQVSGVVQPIPGHIIHEFSSPGGQKVRVGLVGVVLPFNQQPYLEYLPVEETFIRTCAEIEAKSDLILGITHLGIDEDMRLAARSPNVPLFMGGHDHNHMGHYVEQTVITKADANAKTAYIHRITWNPSSGMARIRSTLKNIDDTIAEDPETKAVVEKWEQMVFGKAEKMGYQPRNIIMQVTTPLECSESIIRKEQTNYGRLATAAMHAALPGADVYWINSGSMRLDDRLSGAVTEFDVLRTFPYGGRVVRMEIPGSVLEEVIKISMTQNKGEGGYFQLLGASSEPDGDGRWLVSGMRIIAEKAYTVVMPQFVAEGKEARLGVLGQYPFTSPEMLPGAGTAIRNDIRDLVIQFMKTVR
jgi:2',3'-cyclic-nucleotide 2'-phosphodiesterase (5'-nucleotidase family)